VFNSDTQALVFDGFVYNPAFTGGVRVAMGDVTGDGVPDLITAAGIGGGPHIQVFQGPDFVLRDGFFAYEPSFSQGVYVTVGDVRVMSFPGFADVERCFALSPDYRQGIFVAAGDMDGDGKAEIAVGPSADTASQVIVVRSNGQVVGVSVFDLGPLNGTQPLPA